VYNGHDFIGVGSKKIRALRRSSPLMIGLDFVMAYVVKMTEPSGQLPDTRQIESIG